MIKNLFIKGARQHNLKNIDVTIPRNTLTVITGLSGSGKSSLAFDTIYAEGQRRYVESLSAYARQFLGQMDKPDVDYIEGLSPTISIQQRTLSRNPRSTVGTVTEIFDYLRLLFASIGIPHCPGCGRPVESLSIDEIVDLIFNLPEGEKFYIFSPVVSGRKGEYKRLFEEIRKEGYIRVRVDGKIYQIDEAVKNLNLKKTKKHDIDILIDRLVIKSDIRSRLTDSVETALKESDGVLIIHLLNSKFSDGSKEKIYSEHFMCPHCNISFPEISPRLFSFNNPYGACPDCSGLGVKFEMDPDLILPDMDLSINDGLFDHLSGFRSDNFYRVMRILSKKYKFSLKTPFNKYPRKIKDLILYGSKGEKLTFKLEGENYNYEVFQEYSGIVNILDRRYHNTRSDYMRNYYQQFMSYTACPACNGLRLKETALSILINGYHIIQLTAMTIKELVEFFYNLKLSEVQQKIARQILKEILSRLRFLMNVGLDYLTLDRMSGTLSGGEAERIKLATQIGSQLVGVIYILDEPTIGLHQRDNARLLKTLKELRDLGNTLIVVEHDEETILEADHIIDLGPGAGREGGDIVVSGTVEEVLKSSVSLTGQYLNRKLTINTPGTRRLPDERYLEVIGAGEHNLKNIDVKFPVGLFTCVTGVSGSGKSTLVNDILYTALRSKFYRSHEKPGLHKDIKGDEHFDKVINISQAPIGRTSRSNPATYTKVFDHIRKLFSDLPDSRARGYKPGRFSFNVKGGRCEHCSGDGVKKIEMHFLPDVYVKCEVCNGKRFNRETLQIKFKGKTIADVLDMTVEEAREFFQNIPKIKRKLNLLMDVGLDYIHLGQPAPTLSGGEAQRIKLTKELSKRDTGRTLYILDEPTTGLHFADIDKLLKVLFKLRDRGNTIIVIEHNLDVIKTADYLIDLGPEGGDRGGHIIAHGSPEKIMKDKISYTGKFLKKHLEDEN